MKENNGGNLINFLKENKRTSINADGAGNIN